MKLNIDCIRDTLLELEKLPVDCHTVYTFQKSIERHGIENVEYTLAKLQEADYIKADIRLHEAGRYDFYGIYCISFAGHEFLESVKQPSIWEKLKQATTTGSTAGVSMLKEIAVELGKEMLRKKFGLT
ncbi:MAG: DUF2513 domain-containing protein [Ruminococcaceae bacterium]|nr:DUF2513 domain-containing protein [Oscillospiraceae bacterium]